MVTCGRFYVSRRNIWFVALAVATTVFIVALYHASKGPNLGSIGEGQIGEFILNPEDFELTNISRKSHKNDDEEQIKLYGNLEDSEIRINHDMFFFVTSGAADLDDKQACVVEAAASLHSHKRVFILFITKSEVKVLGSKTLSLLISYDNVYMRSIKLSKYFTQSNAKSWLLNSNFQKTDYYEKFLRDALTYVFLDKYGGIVLDFDILLLKSFKSRESLLNRCSNQDQIESTPMAMVAKHPLLYDLISELDTAFDSSNTHSIGKDLITKFLKKGCKVSSIRELVHKQCKKSATVLSKLTDFCPLPNFKKWMIYNSNYAKFVTNKIEEVNSFGIKLWSADEDNVWGIETAPSPFHFHKLAKTACPLITEITTTTLSYLNINKLEVTFSTSGK